MFLCVISALQFLPPLHTHLTNSYGYSTESKFSNYVTLQDIEVTHPNISLYVSNVIINTIFRTHSNILFNKTKLILLKVFQ